MIEPTRIPSSVNAAKPTMGTDFSGLETPARALRAVGIDVQLLFCSETEKCLRDLIMLDHAPDVLYTDAESRELENVPVVQLYVAGPPPANRFQGPAYAKGIKIRGARIPIIAKIISPPNARLPLFWKMS